MLHVQTSSWRRTCGAFKNYMVRFIYLECYYLLEICKHPTLAKASSRSEKYCSKEVLLPPSPLSSVSL